MSMLLKLTFHIHHKGTKATKGAERKNLSEIFVVFVSLW